jgi:tetratricopeptide (TPR) repeat protein
VVLCNYAKSLRELARLDEAATFAERAYAKAQSAGLPLGINTALIQRAKIYSAQGNPSRAAAMLAEVEPRLQKSLPPGHYVFAVMASEKALNALARGDLSTAIELANHAVSINEAAIKAGADGGFYLPTVLITRSTVELSSQRFDMAKADADRAVTILQASLQPGAFSSHLGHAYLTQGLALQGQGMRPEARVKFRLAADHLQATIGPDHPDTRSARHLAEANAQQQ